MVRKIDIKAKTMTIKYAAANVGERRLRSSAAIAVATSPSVP